MTPKYDFRRSSRAMLLRAYLQALIDTREEAPVIAETFADEITNTYWYVDDQQRAMVGAILTAYIDGWDTGYNSGFDGCDRDYQRLAERRDTKGE